MSELIEIELSLVLDSLKDKLPNADFERMHELIQVREWGVCFQNLCDQLYEYDVRISSETYKRIEAIGNRMELPASNWKPLQELVEH